MYFQTCKICQRSFTIKWIGSSGGDYYLFTWQGWWHLFSITSIHPIGASGGNRGGRMLQVLSSREAHLMEPRTHAFSALTLIWWNIISLSHSPQGEISPILLNLLESPCNLFQDLLESLWASCTVFHFYDLFSHNPGLYVSFRFNYCNGLYCFICYSWLCAAHSHAQWDGRIYTFAKSINKRIP